MPDEYIRSLAQKWLAGEATAEEVKILLQWYEDADTGLDIMPASEGSEERIRERIMMHIPQGEITPAPVRVFYARTWFKAAAGIILLAGMWYGYERTHSVKQDRRVVEVYVPKEQRNRIVLPDSSVVWLNADSKLQYRENEQEHTREVVLDGEAFFDIKQDAGKPFIVKAGKSITTVLGTSFNIKAYKKDGNVQITVATGKVQVQDEMKRLTVLTPNKQIRLKEKQDVAIETSVNAAISNAWIDGAFEINNETFDAVANTLSRKYNVSFHFENESLRKCTFIAGFDKHASLHRVLELLCKINNSAFSISEDQKEVYITGEGCTQDQ